MTTIYKVAIKTGRGAFPDVTGPLMEAIKARPELFEYLPEDDPEFTTQELDENDNPIETLSAFRIPRHHPEFIAALESIDSKDWQGLEIIELERPEYSLYENEYLIEHLVVPSTSFDARIIRRDEDSPYVHTPHIPVTILEELLSDFCGDGTSGEQYLTRHIEEIIEKARTPAKPDKVEWKTIKDLPELFKTYSPTSDFLKWCNTANQNQAIPQEWLDYAAKPLPEGDYKIANVGQVPENELVGLKFTSGHFLFIWEKDLKGFPEVGGVLQVKHDPLSYACRPPEPYSLKERLELCKQKPGYETLQIDLTSYYPEYHHRYMDSLGIPRNK